MPELFEKDRAAQDDTLIDSLYEQIGRLRVELEWLEKWRRLPRSRHDGPWSNSMAS